MRSKPWSARWWSRPSMRAPCGAPRCFWRRYGPSATGNKSYAMPSLIFFYFFCDGGSMSIAQPPHHPVTTDTRTGAGAWHDPAGLCSFCLHRGAKLRRRPDEVGQGVTTAVGWGGKPPPPPRSRAPRHPISSRAQLRCGGRGHAGSGRYLSSGGPGGPLPTPVGKLRGRVRSELPRTIGAATLLCAVCCDQSSSRPLFLFVVAVQPVTRRCYDYIEVWVLLPCGSTG